MLAHAPCSRTDCRIQFAFGQISQEFCGQAVVMTVASGEPDLERQAFGVHDHVQLGGQSPAGTSHKTVSAAPFMDGPPLTRADWLISC